MHKRTMAIALTAWLAGLCLGPAASHAASQRTPRQRRGRTPTDKGPAETREERDRRLQRECRGRPNAGACEGYGG